MGDNTTYKGKKPAAVDSSKSSSALSRSGAPSRQGIKVTSQNLYGPNTSDGSKLRLGGKGIK